MIGGIVALKRIRKIAIADECVIIASGAAFPGLGGLDAEDTPFHLSRSMNAASLAGEINSLAVKLEALLNRVPGNCPAVMVHELRTAGKSRQANLAVSIHQANRLLFLNLDASRDPPLQHHLFA
jgi:hypothetical protein